MIPARFAANLDWLYTDRPYLERPQAAREDGFATVELQQPHLHDAGALAERLSGLSVALMNAPAGDWAAGERGFAALPGQQARFREATLRGLELAAWLGAPRLHLLSGLAEDGAETRATWLDNLGWAAEQAGDITLTVEPINRIDMPGYFLHRQAQALALLADLASPRVALQLDLYHCRRTEGESLSHLGCALDLGLLGHVQVAGVDGRHEPGRAEYAAELALLDECGWAGTVGLEYRPRGDTSAGLAWLTAAR
ncbi:MULTISPECIES: hydroxypyruvate isomerase family protein [Roseateles]|uniref:TIM barrel protein n=1 Tax=Pelomonas caseinilytica TaxID=2906763 RepID=A0ABS8XBM2_9BURK|nr:TIM barrel protein [Roseateles sp.]MCE4538354.1 TIM barrel protein [Pelomonas sp. P7]HEV6964760.1 TIM barrel protein [Roseateles sp.]